MIIKIPKGTAIAFRNPQILCVDTKRVTLERALTNLYMKYLPKEPRSLWHTKRA